MDRTTVMRMFVTRSPSELTRTGSYTEKRSVFFEGRDNYSNKAYDLTNDVGQGACTIPKLFELLLERLLGLTRESHH